MSKSEILLSILTGLACLTLPFWALAEDQKQEFPKCPTSGFLNDCTGERLKGNNGLKEIGTFKNNQLWDGETRAIADDELRFVCKKGQCRGIHTFFSVRSASIFGAEEIKKNEKGHWLVGNDPIPDGKKEGLLFYQWPTDKYAYVNFKNDDYNGFGYFQLNGQTFSGTYQNHLRHGFGKLTWSDGSFFIGEYANNAREGLGVLSKPDGLQKAGLWKGDKFHKELDIDVAYLLERNPEFQEMSTKYQAEAAKKLAYLDDWRDSSGGKSLFERWHLDNALLAIIAFLILVVAFLLPKEIKDRLKIIRGDAKNSNNGNRFGSYSKSNCDWAKIDNTGIATNRTEWHCKSCGTNAYTFNKRPPVECKNPSRFR